MKTEIRLVAIEVHEGETHVLAEAVACWPQQDRARIFIGNKPQQITSIKSAYHEVFDVATEATKQLADMMPLE